MKLYQIPKRILITEGQLGLVGGRSAAGQVDPAPADRRDNQGYMLKQGFSRFVEMISQNEKLTPQNKAKAIAQLKALMELGSNNMIVADAAGVQSLKQRLLGSLEHQS